MRESWNLECQDSWTSRLPPSTIRRSTMKLNDNSSKVNFSVISSLVGFDQPMYVQKFVRSLSLKRKIYKHTPEAIYTTINVLLDSHITLVDVDANDSFAVGQQANLDRMETSVEQI